MAPEALHLYGHIHHSRVTVLIDWGRTYNFIQTRAAKYLQLPMTPTPPLQVTIGNGTTLPCDQLCLNVVLLLQGQTFHVDLHVLLISGTDIVLDVQWLRQLGHILTNYDTLTMQFRYNGDFVVLQADAPTTPVDTFTLQLHRLIQTHSTS